MEIKKRTYIYACLAIITIGILYFGYLLAIDGVWVNVPLTFKTNVGQTDKQVYQHGDPVAFKWDYCKGVNTVSDVSVNLTDGIVYFLPMINSNRSKGCYDEFSVVASIPDVIPSGEYFLTGIVHFKINSLKDVDYRVTSDKFIIQ